MPTPRVAEECKWASDPVDVGVLETLKMRGYGPPTLVDDCLAEEGRTAD